MAQGDTFGFDISAAKDKKKRRGGRRGMSGAFETSTRVCEHEGCEDPGQYRAPKSPEQLDEFYWFCRTHVREYNLKWNFFDGSTEADYEDRIEHDRVWGRSTSPFGKPGEEQRAWARLGIDDPHQVLGDNATRNKGDAPGKGNARRLPATERRALDILEARDTWSKDEIRSKYRSLVKDLHPDMNGGTRSDEERLQEVVWAWDQIKESRHFRE